MEKKDLMIGDWVLCDNAPYQIAEIGGMVCIEAEQELFASLDDIRPIPLTAEILEKNGWVNYENDTESFHDKDCVFISQIEGGYGVCIDKVRTISGVIHYVHELQHALRLCGIEKEIEL